MKAITVVRWFEVLNTFLLFTLLSGLLYFMFIAESEPDPEPDPEPAGDDRYWQTVPKTFEHLYDEEKKTAD